MQCNLQKNAEKDKLDKHTCTYLRDRGNSARREKGDILFGGRLAAYTSLYLRHSSRISVPARRI